MQSLRLYFAIGIWAVLLFAVLQVGRIAGDHSHSYTHGTGLSICGSWGCGPPVEALIGWHAFWIVFLALPLAVAIRTWSLPLLRSFGLTVLVLGLLMVLGICAWETLTWNGDRAYLLHHYLFAVVTQVDVPAIPITLAGAGLTCGWLIRSRRLTTVPHGQCATSSGVT
jgi:hypothetical protein